LTPRSTSSALAIAPFRPTGAPLVSRRFIRARNDHIDDRVRTLPGSWSRGADRGAAVKEDA